METHDQTVGLSMAMEPWVSSHDVFFLKKKFNLMQGYYCHFE